MSTLPRAILLIAAVYCIGFCASLGIRFSAMAEPNQQGVGKIIFWLILSILLFAGLWWPAVVAKRDPSRSRRVRWISILLLMPPLYLLVPLAMNRLQRLNSVPEFDSTWMLQGVAPCVLCIVGLLILVICQIKKEEGYAA